MKKITFSTFRYAAVAVAAAASLALSSCGAYDENRNAATPTPTYVASALSINETWAKAIDAGMTSAFGTLKNTSGQDITVVGATTEVAKTAELHEVIQSTDGSMKMQAKEGGFTVPAGGELVMEPGGQHIMLMGLLKPAQAGDEIPLTLELANGETLEFTALVKDFSGANENYGDLEDHGDMDHGDMDHSDMGHDAPADAK